MTGDRDKVGMGAAAPPKPKYTLANAIREVVPVPPVAAQGWRMPVSPLVDPGKIPKHWSNRPHMGWWNREKAETGSPRGGTPLSGVPVSWLWLLASRAKQATSPSC